VPHFSAILREVGILILPVPPAEQHFVWPRPSRNTAEELRFQRWVNGSEIILVL
jgi:hypothetical protein